MIDWPTVRPTFPLDAISRSNDILSLDLDEKVRKEVLSNKNLRDYGLWVEPNSDLPTPQDVPEEWDIPDEGANPEPVSSSTPSINITYFVIMF